MIAGGSNVEYLSLPGFPHLLTGEARYPRDRHASLVGLDLCTSGLRLRKSLSAIPPSP